MQEEQVKEAMNQESLQEQEKSPENTEQSAGQTYDAQLTQLGHNNKNNPTPILTDHNTKEQA